MTSRRIHRRAGAAMAMVLMVGLAIVGATPSVAAPASAQTYVVLYKKSASPGDAASTVQRAGGTLVANWDSIGVVVARSSSAGFASALQADSRVQGVA